jgi:hypothetical protein
MAITISFEQDSAPQLDTSAYASGDILYGASSSPKFLTFAGAGERGGVLQSVEVYDSAGQSAEIDLLFYNAAPTGTYGAVNAAYVIQSADRTKRIMGGVKVLASDYVSEGAVSGGNGGTSAAREFGRAFQKTVTGNLFCLPVSRGAPTYAATSLRFVLNILRDDQ